MNVHVSGRYGVMPKTERASGSMNGGGKDARSVHEVSQKTRRLGFAVRRCVFWEGRPYTSHLSMVWMKIIFSTLAMVQGAAKASRIQAAYHSAPGLPDGQAGTALTGRPRRRKI